MVRYTALTDMSDWLDVHQVKKLEAQEEAFATREEHLKRMYITQIEDAKTEAVAAKESAEVSSTDWSHDGAWMKAAGGEEAYN